MRDVSQWVYRYKIDLMKCQCQLGKYNEYM